ncbi:hypothetical protein SCODD09_00974 [Streptococcus constellatus]|nr:hypothetical protein SCODD09_00974 [Streptococcus constellatus]
MSKEILTGLSQKEVKARVQKGLVNEVTVSTEKQLGKSFSRMCLLILILYFCPCCVASYCTIME